MDSRGLCSSSGPQSTFSFGRAMSSGDEAKSVAKSTSVTPPWRPVTQKEMPAGLRRPPFGR
jgi:hypothetical protein